MRIEFKLAVIFPSLIFLQSIEIILIFNSLDSSLSHKLRYSHTIIACIFSDKTFIIFSKS